MLKTKLIHPDILQALAGAGHGGQVLITDGHYPASTKIKPGIKPIYLNIAPGMISVTDLLEVLAATIEIEAVTVMAPDTEPMPEIFAEFKEIIPKTAEFIQLGRFEFYDHCVENPDLCLVLVSGDVRKYANILITIGVCEVSP